MIEKVIIAIPSATGRTTSELVKKCENAKVSVKILPNIVDLIGGQVTMIQVKDVEIDDLLRRNTMRLDKDSIRNYLTGKRILVAGAAGSIGRDLQPGGEIQAGCGALCAGPGPDQRGDQLYYCAVR